MGKRRSKKITGLGRSVEEHPLYEEILELARHRFTPESIVKLLQWQYRAAFENETLPPLPTVRTFHRWRNERMPDADVLPPRVLEARLKRLDRKVDLLQQLQDLYTAQENRVAAMLQSQEGFPLLMPAVDRAVETLLKIAEQLWRVGQDMGLYPRGPGATVAMGVKGADGTAAFAILQVGDAPSRMIDLANLDLSSLSELEMTALRRLQLPAPKEADESGRSSRAAAKGG